MRTRRPRPRSARVPGRPLLGGARALGALALSIAAGLHLAQGLRHLHEGSSHARLHGAFFFAAGLFQVAAAVGLEAGVVRRWVRVITTANLGLAAVWALAVSVGLPGSLAPAGPEPVTLAGGAATVAEVLAVTALVAARRRLEDQSTPLHGDHAVLRVPLVAAGLALMAGPALPVSGQAHHHEPSSDAHHASRGHPRHHPGTDTHLHGLGGGAPDPGPDPRRQEGGVLAGTRLPAGRQPAAVAVQGGVVWVADREGGVVHRLDGDSGHPLGVPRRVGAHPSGVALGAGAAWVTNAGSDSVSRLDQASGETLATIPVGSVPVGVAVGAGSVWVTNSADGTVSRIDPRTGDVVTTPRIGYGLTAITVAAGRAWVVASLDRAVLSLDLGTAAVVTRAPVGAGASSVAFGHGSIWVAGSSAGTVTRVDALSGEVIGPPIVVDGYAQPGQGPAALAVGDRVWVLNNHDKTVVGIDPSTRAVSSPQFVDRHVARHINPASLALSDNGDLWATDADSGRVVRLQPREDRR